MASARGGRRVVGVGSGGRKAAPGKLRSWSSSQYRGPVRNRSRPVNPMFPESSTRIRRKLVDDAPRPTVLQQVVEGRKKWEG